MFSAVVVVVVAVDDGGCVCCVVAGGVPTMRPHITHPRGVHGPLPGVPRPLPAPPAAPARQSLLHVLPDRRCVSALPHNLTLVHVLPDRRCVSTSPHNLALLTCGTLWSATRACCPGALVQTFFSPATLRVPLYTCPRFTFFFIQ